MPERFSPLDAVGWTLAVTFGWMLAAILVHGLAPHAQHDLVMAGGVQIAVFLVTCALFAGRRPGRSWSDLFGTRPTSVGFLLLALALGVALCPPAERLALSIQNLFPLPKELLAEQEAMLRPRSPVHGSLLFLVAVVAGPFAEELFFRGALFTALRPHATTVAAAGTTGLLFTLMHPEPRTWAPILVLAFVLGAVRARSGSLWPSLCVHAGFNGTALGTEFLARGQADSQFSFRAILAGLTASVILLVLLWLLGGSSGARQARELDRGAEA